MNLRPAAVAEIFHKEYAEVLERDIVHMLLPVEETKQLKGIIVRQGGYIYTGRAAASVY